MTATRVSDRQTAAQTQAQPAVSQGEVAVLSGPRLPFHDAIKERFGVDRAGWKALVEAIYPNAKSTDSVCLALAYCKARHLDPFKRPVHIVPMWSTATGGMIDTIWPGISELRTTAHRTKEFAGMDDAAWGPFVTVKFEGTNTRVKRGTQPIDREREVTFPEWCQITVYRLVGGNICKFVGPKTWWSEAYAKWGDTDVPNDMWCERAIGQLEKCAEAAALRRAFPEELGNEYTADEMEGRTLHDASAAQRDLTAPAPPAQVAQIAQARETKQAAQPDKPQGDKPKAEAKAKPLEGEILPAQEQGPQGPKPKAIAQQAAQDDQQGDPVEQAQAADDQVIWDSDPLDEFAHGLSRCDTPEAVDKFVANWKAGIDGPIPENVARVWKDLMAQRKHDIALNNAAEGTSAPAQAATGATEAAAGPSGQADAGERTSAPESDQPAGPEKFETLKAKMRGCRDLESLEAYFAQFIEPWHQTFTEDQFKELTFIKNQRAKLMAQKAK